MENWPSLPPHCKNKKELSTTSPQNANTVETISSHKISPTRSQCAGDAARAVTIQTNAWIHLVSKSSKANNSQKIRYPCAGCCNCTGYQDNTARFWTSTETHCVPHMGWHTKWSKACLMFVGQRSWVWLHSTALDQAVSSRHWQLSVSSQGHQQHHCQVIWFPSIGSHNWWCWWQSAGSHWDCGICRHGGVWHNLGISLTQTDRPQHTLVQVTLVLLFSRQYR